MIMHWQSCENKSRYHHLSVEKCAQPPFNLIIDTSLEEPIRTDEMKLKIKVLLNYKSLVVL